MDIVDLSWLADQQLDRLPQILTALAIGLLIGLERERKPTAKAGLRTFALVALTGAAAAVLAETLAAPSIVGVGLGVVALTMIAAYYHHHEEFHEWDSGTTTIAAAISCYLLAAMVVSGFARLAVILAILATILLYFKTELDGVAHNLERRDLVSILQFAVVTFVVLPLLPDRGFGPYAALNPRHIWLMVVLISGVSLAGYVSLRVIGKARGALVLGLFGGLVSSTATTLAFARHARDGSTTADLSVTVIVAANLVLVLRLGVLITVLAPGVLSVAAPTLGLAFAMGVAVNAITRRRSTGSPEVSMPQINNPSELRAALGFAALYSVILILAAWLQDLAGARGIYAVALVSGLTDLDAISLSVLRLYGLGTFSAAQVTTAIVLAMVANVVFKLGITLVAGDRRLFGRCIPAMIAVAIGAGAGLALFGRS